MPHATDLGQYDLLLCYNSKDVLSVRGLWSTLARCGLHGWLDEEQGLAGSHWRRAVEQGYSQSQAALVVLGPTGFGPSQKQEIDFLVAHCEQDGKRLIFVLLPDSNPSLIDSIGIAGLSFVRVEESIDEDRVIDQIQRALRGGDEPDANQTLGIFQLIQPRQRSCFVAVPRVCKPDLLPQFIRVAEEHQFSIVQDVNWKLPDFDPDVLEGVLNSSLVLADGRSFDQSGKPDSDVNHVLGIARAYHKPLIIVANKRSGCVPTYTANKLLIYDESQPDCEATLHADLSGAIDEVFSSLRYPGVLCPNASGVAVVAQAALRLSPLRWKAIGQSIQACQELQSAFALSAHALHSLRQIAESAHGADHSLDGLGGTDDGSDGFRDSLDLKQRSAIKKRLLHNRWGDFRRLFIAGYLETYHTRVTPLRTRWGDLSNLISSTLATLTRTRDSDARTALCRAGEFLALVQQTMVWFEGCHDEVAAHVEPDPSFWKNGPKWYCDNLATMTYYAEEIRTHSQAAVHCFLPLLGHVEDQSQGVITHVNARELAPARA